MADRTPLYDWHVAHGARLVDFAGWDMPVQYTGIIEEHQAVRTACGLFDISHMGRLVFQGPEARDLLQRLYTNDVTTMKPGQVRYGLVCNEQGGILDDVLVYQFDCFWLMVVNASNRAKIVRWIAANAGSFRAEVTDMTARWAMVAIQGPRALDLLAATERFVEVSPPTDGEPYAEVGKSHSVDLGKLCYYQAQLCPSPLLGLRDDLEVVSRTGYTGEDGYEVIVPATEVVAFCDQLFQTAQRLGIPLKPCGLGARDTLRLEAAMPLYGHELSEEIDPFQAGVGWAVKLDKGDFIGRAALLRRREDRSLRRRVGLELEGKRIAREGAAVLHNGQEIGRVTSGTFAPTIQKSIAMAYIDPAHTTAGTLCTVDVRGKPETAHVVSLPFYRRPR
jgi:aminomethyltransferase